jgi:hypothetical protein
MRKLVARMMVAAALAAFAVPTLACDAMKRDTTAWAPEKAEPKAEAKVQDKAEKKAAEPQKAKPQKVASAEKKL